MQPYVLFSGMDALTIIGYALIDTGACAALWFLWPSVKEGIAKCFQSF